MSLTSISGELSETLANLSFDDPVTHVYNPVDYAWPIHSAYLDTYGKSQPSILLLGMNPGPWGMAQSGVPFGEVGFVRDWMKLDGDVRKPAIEHPKRPIAGLDCPRSEVSGARLWGWAEHHFGTAAAFFEQFFVWNYCPLSFMEASGRNRTPDKLPKQERDPVFKACDDALQKIVAHIEPSWVIGVGAFAEKRAKSALRDYNLNIARILHPSPASPKANSGWAAIVDEQFAHFRILGLPWSPNV